jgi:hypothetical protein
VLPQPTPAATHRRREHFRKQDPGDIQVYLVMLPLLEGQFWAAL